MELQEMLSVQPQQYLQDGFLGVESEDLQGSINGYYSLALAYQLREENIQTEQLESVIKQIELRPTNLDEIRRHFETLKSPALLRLYQAASKWLTEPRQYAAFIEHLKRILSQLALITILPAGDDQS